MKTKNLSCDDTQLSLRLDEPLRRQLVTAAKRSVRSLNGEIV
jgi:predicted HicB family RNase H-like nuclease